MKKIQSKVKPILGAGHRISGDAAGVVIRHHHDDSGSQHRQENEQSPPQAIDYVDQLC